MLWQPHCTDHRDLLSYVTLVVRELGTSYVSTLSVEVVLSCSLTGAVRESSLGWSLCFFLRVGEHGCSGEQLCETRSLRVPHVPCVSHLKAFQDDCLFSAR